MNKYIIKITSILILFMLITSTHYSILAKEQTEKIDVSILNGKIQEEFNPNNGVSGEVKNIAEPFTNVITVVVNSVLGVIQVLGGLLTIISIAIYGFFMVTTSHMRLAHDLGIRRGHSPQVKKAALDFGRHLLIGAILLLTSTTIVRFVFNIFT